MLFQNFDIVLYSLNFEMYQTIVVADGASIDMLTVTNIAIMRGLANVSFVEEFADEAHKFPRDEKTAD